MVLKRRAYYPVMTLVIPCVITAVLLCLTFLMPPDAGEKVGLSELYNILTFAVSYMAHII